MAFSGLLEQAGYNPERIHTRAKVHIEQRGEGFKITLIELNTSAVVPGIDEETFLTQAKAAKNDCPVSQALKGIEIKLTASLE